jgi:hypothetical protein
MQIAHYPMQDKSIIAFINQIFPQITFEKLMELPHENLDHSWRKWLKSSSYNIVEGLDELKYSAFSPGTTDAFGEFIARYPNKRIRVSRSDFILTKILSKSYGRNLLYLEEGNLENNDAVIISLPFSGNGNEYPNFDSVLDQADELDVPVFIDGAYFGISSEVKYPLHRKCIKDFAVSLSKNLAGHPLRLGMRFTKEEVDDGITAGLIGSDVYDRLGAYISIELLNKFSHDWLIDRYRDKSVEFCNKNGLTQTKTFTLALGTSEMTEFKRGDYVRISITEELSEIVGRS